MLGFVRTAGQAQGRESIAFLDAVDDGRDNFHERLGTLHPPLHLFGFGVGFIDGLLLSEESGFDPGGGLFAVILPLLIGLGRLYFHQAEGTESDRADG